MTKIVRRNQAPVEEQLALPLFSASLHFFTMFSQQIRSGYLIPKIGPSAFSILILLRSHADLETGRIYLSLSQIEELTGMANMTIRKAIKTLEDEGLVRIVSDSNSKKRRYFVIDLVPFKNSEGDPQRAAAALLEGEKPDGLLAVPYVPNAAAGDRKAISRFLKDGSLPLAGNIQVVEGQAVVAQTVNQQAVANQTVAHQTVHNTFHFNVSEGAFPDFIQRVMDKHAPDTENTININTLDEEPLTISTDGRPKKNTANR